MKKAISIVMIASSLAAASCSTQTVPESSSPKGLLTAEEISAARFTPEVMWKMGRLGEAALSPDGTMAVYTVTRYDMQENKGTTVIFLHDMATGSERALTDTSSNASSPQWNSDSKRIYFLSDRSGTMQVWSMNPDGGDVRQVSDIHEGIDAYGIAPTEQKLFFTRKVHAADRRSADVYKDMDKSQARIYDDLMCRHWNYWDEGDYSHIFIADIRPEGLINPVDILGEDAAWDAPLAPYFDASEIAWSPDGTKLAYTCKKLTGTAYAVSTDSDIYVYDTADGSTVNINKPLTGGLSNDPAAPRIDVAEAVGYDRYPVWSPDGKRIAYRSMATPGYESDKDRLMIYDTGTEKITDLSANFDHSAQNVAWTDKDNLLFISAIEGTQQICAVAVPASGNGAETEVKVLTSGDHHISSFSWQNGKCIAAIMTISRDNELFAMDLASGKGEQITFVNKEIYDNIHMGEVQKRWVTTTDGKHMGDPAPGLRPREEIPHAALLRGRPAKHRHQRLELPLELPAHGGARICRRGAQPSRMPFVRQRVARADLGRLLGAEHQRLPLGHRRRGTRAVVRHRPHGMCRSLVRRIFGILPCRTPRGPIQGLHLALRYLRLRIHVRPDRGALLHQPRLWRPILGEGERHGHALV